jgi:tetratricopeptide (TPR) repeat protein
MSSLFQAAQAAFGQDDYASAHAACLALLSDLTQEPTTESNQRLRIAACDLLIEIARRDANHHIQVDAVLREAERAARRLNDALWDARLRRHRAWLQLTTHSLPTALRTMQEAQHLARTADDKLLEWIIFAERGHYLVGEDLKRGLALQYEAYRLYNEQLHPLYPDSHELQAQVYILLARIGINEFDIGHFDPALEHLDRGIAGMRSMGMKSDLPWALNYLAQVYTASGRFEAAEQVLVEALDLQESLVSDANKSNNLALLGKLYLEWERLDDADGPMRQGWAVAQMASQLALISLVRNYFAELLMHVDYQFRDLAAAEEQLIANLFETHSSRFHRSAIQALSLHALLALYQGKPELARERSSEAVDYLERMGSLPALRSEEIFWNHASILSANNRKAEADAFVKRAYQIVQAKAESIAAPEMRRLFLERVLLNRKIADALEKLNEPRP